MQEIELFGFFGDLPDNNNYQVLWFAIVYYLAFYYYAYNY